MFTRIVVPLDGSLHAETVLPWVQRLAPTLGAEVHLLRVVNLAHITPSLGPDAYISANVYQQALDGETRAAGDYLAGVGERLQAAGCAVTSEVGFAQPAQAIVESVEQKPFETLVAMATHGRTGLARFALGSVAGQVVRAVEAPVLLVRPLAEQPRMLDSILVPLDGSFTAEAVLPVVQVLAPVFAARVHLMIATEQYEDESIDYLEQVADGLKRGGVADVTPHIVPGAPVDAVLDMVDRQQISLIAMATHGRTGVRHWVLGSVAEKVLHLATVPTLMVHGHAVEPEQPFVTGRRPDRRPLSLPLI